jgi:REP element-mobilizing transposase RayT
VFSTKYRRKQITSDIQEALYQYIGGIIRNISGVLLEIGGIEDHVHMLVGMPPTICISDMLQSVKASSSGWMNDQPIFFRQLKIRVATGLRSVYRKSFKH